MDSDTERRPDDWYAWWVALVGTVAMVFTFGTPYSYGVFLGPLGDVFGLSTVALSTVFSAELFVFYVGAGVVGVFAARLPARRVLLVSGLLAGAVSPLLYVVDSYAGLVVVFSLFGIAIGTTFVVLSSIVPQWFEARRGLATAVLFAGAGLGLQVMPPAWQFAFDRLGVRAGFLVLAATSAGAFLLAGAFGRRPPWAGSSSVSAAELRAWLATLARSRRFHFLFVGVGLAFAWYYVLASFAIDLLQARGFSAAGASVTFGFVGGVSVFSRFASGAAADRIGYRVTYLLSLGFAAFGSAALLLPGRYALGLAILCFGVGLGGIATLYIPVLLDIYDPAMDTAVVGVFNMAFGVFALLAPPLGTWLVAATGTFAWAIVLSGVTSVVSVTALWLGFRH